MDWSWLALVPWVVALSYVQSAEALKMPMKLQKSRRTIQIKTVLVRDIHKKRLLLDNRS